MKKLNRLSLASSPYLRQHAENPVDWYEWGEEALTKAKKENKPLIISIGYAACHWCHVMAHESFSDNEIADFMNTNFVCIKVDREERPDIDHIYMEAVQLLNGRGGWPLNAFALADGRPFFAASYFPPSTWLDALHQLSSVYHNDKKKVMEAAESLTRGIAANHLEIITDPKPFTVDEYRVAYENHIQSVDFESGGYIGAPKFMMPTGLEFLLQYFSINREQKALDAITVSLDAMAKGGIYDQIGGGFARYSTDKFWKVPHFEKMLYDNAQLIRLYAHAFQLTKKPLYADIIEQTISFAERELLDAEGGFYASIDADSDHQEGKFYVWTKAEIESVLDKRTAEIILKFYQASSKGNWEDGKNILHYTVAKELFATTNKMTANEFNAILQNANKLLLEQRNLRTHPTTDNKILCSWNALMLSGYVNAYKAIRNENYLNRAINTARFLEKHMITETGLLYRVFMDGKVSTEAFLDDYAILAEAFIDLYEVTFDPHWLTLSKLLIHYVWNHFGDEQNRLFYYTSDQAEGLIARKHEITDNVIPSSNSILANVLYKSGILFENTDYTRRAETMLFSVRNEISLHGIYFANWAILLGKLTHPSYEIAILGVNALKIGLEMQTRYLPTALFAGGNTENLPILKQRLIKDKTMIYVCEDKACNLGVESADDALELMKKLI